MCTFKLIAFRYFRYYKHFGTLIQLVIQCRSIFIYKTVFWCWLHVYIDAYVCNTCCIFFLKRIKPELRVSEEKAMTLCLFNKYVIKFIILKLIGKFG